MLLFENTDMHGVVGGYATNHRKDSLSLLSWHAPCLQHTVAHALLRSLSNSRCCCCCFLIP